MDGIINVYKEKGYTSHDVVARLRGITGERHIGHTGTLDPAAVGVLPVCLGMSTKVCDILTDRSKTYETVLLLGITTDTEDSTGTILKTGDVSNITIERLKEVISEFIGDIEQVPPMYSAIKVNGQKLYDLARQGISLEREKRRVHIDNIEIISNLSFGELGDIHSFDTGNSLFKQFDDNEFSEKGRWQWNEGSIINEDNKGISVCRVALKVSCEKGTYIRTLCHDIGLKLGCGACMERLLRTRVGEFGVEDSFKLEKIEEFFKSYKDNGAELPKELLISTDKCFEHYLAYNCKEKYDSVLLNGNIMRLRHFKEFINTPESIVRAYDSKGNFIAVYEWVEEKNYYKPLKMFKQT